MVKFELKKIKYFDEMSEETPCFTADIWENGKKVAEVRNDGHGGDNMVSHVHGVNSYKDVAKFDNLDVEADIFGRVWDHYDAKRLQTKNWVLKKDEKICTVKFPMSITQLKKASNFQSWREKQKIRFKKQGYKILNTNL